MIQTLDYSFKMNYKYLIDNRLAVFPCSPRFLIPLFPVQQGCNLSSY